MRLLLVLPLLLDIVACTPPQTHLSVSSEAQQVSTLAQHLQRPDCLLALAHDYYPAPLSELLLSGHPVLLLQWDTQPLPPKGPKDHWFHWLQQESARDLGHCALFVLVFQKTQHLTHLLHQLAARMVLRPASRNTRFLLWHTQQQGATVSDALLQAAVSSRMLLALAVSFQQRSDNRSSEMKLWHLCHYCGEGSVAKMVLGGTYDAESRCLLPRGTQDLFPDTTHDLRGKHLNGTLLFPISSEDVRHVRASFLPMIPFMVALLDIGDYLHFDWHMDPLDTDNGIGADVPLADGNWTGCTGDVLSGRTDIGVVIHSPDGYRVVDYATPNYFSYITYLIRKPRILYSWKALLLPFPPQLWALLFLATLFSGLVLWALLWYGPPDPPVPTRGLHLASLALHWVFVAHLDQGVDCPPHVLRSFSPRIFLTFFWFFSMVMMSAYEADLVSFLTAPDQEELPSSFREMVHWAAGWKWGMMYYSGPYLETLAEGLHHDYKDMIAKAMTFPDIQTCTQHVLRDDFSCISIPEELVAWSMQLVDSQGYNPTQVQFQDITGRSMSLIAGFNLEKYGVLTPVMNRLIQYEADSGLMDKYESDYGYACLCMGLKAARKEGKLHEASQVVQPLRITQLGGPFFLLIFAWGLGLVAFAYERLRQRNSCCRRATRS